MGIASFPSFNDFPFNYQRRVVSFNPRWVQPNNPNNHGSFDLICF